MLLEGNGSSVVHGASPSRPGSNGELVRTADMSAWNDPAVKALCTAPDGGSWAAYWNETATDCQLGVIGEDGRFKSHWHFGERIEAMTWANDTLTAYAVPPDSGTVFELHDGSPVRRRP